jgi:hypothetical protein
LRVDPEEARLAGALLVELDEARLAGDLRGAGLAGALRVFPVAFAAEAELLRVAGFFLPALEPVERDFARLLGFFGVAIPTHYSEER